MDNTSTVLFSVGVRELAPVSPFTTPFRTRQDVSERCTSPFLMVWLNGTTLAVLPSPVRLLPLIQTFHLEHLVALVGISDRVRIGSRSNFDTVAAAASEVSPGNKVDTAVDIRNNKGVMAVRDLSRDIIRLLHRSARLQSFILIR